jgi:ASPIC and UnbV.
MILTACSQQESQTRLFVLLSPKETGVSFINKLEEKKLNILEYMYYYNGGGVAIGDINNDGFADLYFTSNEGPNSLYLNNGDFTFTDISIDAGVQGDGDWSTGVSMADVNGDGLLDIYVCGVSGYKGLSGHNQLFINNGDLTFTECAKEWGLDFAGFSTQACFFDYDNDGDLDVYLLNHSVHSTRSYGKSTLRHEKDSLAGDRLMRNLSRQGKRTFEDVTGESGIYSSHIGYGLGVSGSDLNGDGWMDLYISNDFHENDYLYINNHDGTFSESLEARINHTSRYSMGNDIADVNGDGLPDIITVDMLPYESEILLRSASEDLQEVYDIKQQFGYANQYVRNCLQINRGDHFIEVAQLAGIHATDWSWAPLICDLDNDGMQDIFITNGIFKRPNDLDYIQYTSHSVNQEDNSTEGDAALIEALPTLKIPNFAFHNSPNTTFKNLASQWGLDTKSWSNGAAYADLDNDGDLDLVINNVNQPAFIYENRSRQHNQNTFVTISLDGGDLFNKFGIGAKVIVHTPESHYMRELSVCRGFQSSVEPILHFGLGSSASVDSIEVFWGTRGYQVVRDVQINKKTHIAIKPQLQNVAEKQYSSVLGLASLVKLPFEHIENAVQDFAREPLIPASLAREGPALAVGDVNGDGLDDLYFGGAHGQAGVLLLQERAGNFTSMPVADFDRDYQYEDVDAFFRDMNGDGNIDLYVVSGGNQYPEGHELLSDRLYLNNGNGTLVRSHDLLPALGRNGGCAVPLDFNNDGAIDIFLGVRSVPGKYGTSPKSYILKNDGSGKFTIHSSFDAGMVTGAVWADFDGKGKYRLAVAAEWSPIRLFEITDTECVLARDQMGLEGTNGLWQTIAAADLDNDGNLDIIGGNIGNNNRFNPSEDKPVSLLIGDFDQNGQSDPLVFYYLGSANIPLMPRSQVGKQLPMLNKKFKSFSEFSSVKSPLDLLSEKAVATAQEYHVYSTETTAWMQRSGRFMKMELPPQVQYSTVRSLLVKDFDRDGHLEVILGGNFFRNHVMIGDADAQAMACLKATGSGDYFHISLTNQSNVRAAYRKLATITLNSRDYLVAARNNGAPDIFSADSVALRLRKP